MHPDYQRERGIPTQTNHRLTVQLPYSNGLIFHAVKSLNNGFTELFIRTVIIQAPEFTLNMESTIFNNFINQNLFRIFQEYSYYQVEFASFSFKNAFNLIAVTIT